MSKCDTMRPGDVLRLRNRETKEVIQVRVVDAMKGRADLATDASQVWIITRVPAGQRESDS